MIKFSKDKVLLLHKLIAEETGGSMGVRDEGLLESALESAFSDFGGQEFYPSKEEKGARLGYALISNHAFVDGNKRIGVYIMLTFLEVSPTGVEPSSVFTGGFPSVLRYCPCKAGKASLRSMPRPGKNPLRKNCPAHLSE